MAESPHCQYGCEQLMGKVELGGKGSVDYEQHEDDAVDEEGILKPSCSVETKPQQ